MSQEQHQQQPGEPVSPYGTANERVNQQQSTGSSVGGPSPGPENSRTPPSSPSETKAEEAGNQLEKQYSNAEAKAKDKEQGQQQEEENEPPFPAWKSLIGTLIVHVVGGLIVLAGSQGSCNVWGPTVLDGNLPVFAIAGIWNFLVQYIAFIPAWCLNTEKFYDLVGGFTHISSMLLAVILSWHTIDYRGITAAVCVTLWASRLAVYLFMRLRGEGISDSRFDKIKYNFWQFFMTWSLQGLWVTINTTAALAIVTTQKAPKESWAAVGTSSEVDLLAIIGLAIWLFGWLYEVVADEQKRAFRKDKSNKGKWIHSGLWRYSRHPNYFGEITLWTGMAIASITILFGWRWVMLISPCFCCFLLTCVSGIPMLTAKGKEKWGNDEDFLDYLTNTPALIPGPPRCC